MRIWILTSELPQQFAGGIARYVDNYSRLLGAAGHEVVVIARTDQAYNGSTAPGVYLIGIVPGYTRLGELKPGSLPDAHPAYPYNVLAYWPALSYQMAEEVEKLLTHLPPPDIIESQEYGALPYYLLQRKMTERTSLARIPILVHLHSPTFELARPNQQPRYRFPEYWVAQMEKFCIVSSDALLSPSFFLARCLERTLQRSLDIAQIPYPLVLNREPAPSRAQPGHIVYVGRLELRKGVLPLVKACSRLWDEGEDFRLTLVGGDMEFTPKETTVGAFIRHRYSRWMESGHLRLTGQLDQAGAFEHMTRAWAVVVPSLWENFPNTCMEAMGLGQIVLASQTGGQAEMVEADGVNGVLFDWQIPGDFEQKLRLVLALDEEERSKMGERARARIQAVCAPEMILRQRIQHCELVIARSGQRQNFPTLHDTLANRPVAEPHASARTSDVGDEQVGLLSVIIPYYNLGDYLGETVESVLASTYSPFEVLIVNDGSTEQKSLEVLREIESRGLGNVRILSTENRGLATARNTGVEAARGGFIAFVDGDDLVEPDFFKQAIDVLHRYSNVDFVYSWVRYFGESTDIWPTWNAEFPYLLGHNMLAAFAVMRCSSFLKSARNKPELEYGLEDYEGWIALLEAGGVGVSLPRPLVRYRIRPGSMYRRSNQNQRLYLYELITQQHAEAYRESGVELFNLQNANGPAHLWNHPAMRNPEAPHAYINTLEQLRGRLWAEVQSLGKAWETHVRFIESQRAYIEDLEARCGELVRILRENASQPLASAESIAWRDYELGGHLMNRIRRAWLTRQVLRHPNLKKVIKRALGI